jgi:RNA polymerase nonessential primary-like sigma factor
VDLVRKAAAGDGPALTRLYEAHFPLLVRIALTYERPGLEAEDLIGEACVGFTEALSRFDPSRQTRFMTYASWWIRQHVVLALEHVKNVRLPRRARSKMGCGLREVSLSEPGGEETTLALEELIESETATDGSLADCDARHDAEIAMASLPERHRRLILRRFGLDGSDDEGATLRALAVEMGVSRERVRQLEQDALERMREALAEPPTRPPRTKRRQLAIV